MTRAIRIVSLVLVIMLVAGCASPVLHHRSGDGSQEILYLSPFIALWKNHPGGGSQEWMYTLSQASWLNEPELASATGDTIGKVLVDSVVLVGRSKSKGLLIGKGSDPDPQAWPDKDRFFILAYDRLIFFRTEQEMRASLKENWRISAAGLIPVGEFYEQEEKRRQ